ncbi:MAG: ribonuclease D [Alphaproteobacteria bacterium]|nr:ribonuclease D [Alphaproteobacteria bacterium]
MTLVTETAALAAACQRLANVPYVAIDTEFIRETTYWPQLCLAQVSGPDGDAFAVDALAPGIDLTPLVELLAKPDVLKVFHAGRQDIEIFLHLSGKPPTPVFDTQIAAMVCGFGESVSYETLVTRLASARLDKHSRFTDWRRRPLTDRQLHYALDDVVHLRTVYEKLAKRLDDTGRTAWVAEEMAAVTDPATYVTQPHEAWERLKVRSTDPRFLVVLREVAAWREREAQVRDLARSRVLRDEALIAVAAHPPRDRAELTRIRGVSKGLADGSSGGALLEAVQRAVELPDTELPKRDKMRRVPAGVGPMVALLKVLLKMKCEDHDVAQQLVASSDELEDIAAGQTEGSRCMHGWRNEVFGEDAQRLCTGQVAIAARKGKGVILVPLDHPVEAARVKAAG